MISRNYISSVGALVGATVGVGMFTLPHVTTRAGVIPVLAFFIVLGFVQHWLHKLYAEIVLSTKDKHRLPGYAEKYLGASSKKLITILITIACYGSLLAYTIIGGEFSYELLAPWLGGTVFSNT